MKSTIEWLAAIFLIGVFAGSIWWLPFYFEQISNKPQLPYSRPHIELLKPDGTKCAAWVLPQNGAYVMLCENEVPVLIAIHEFRQNMNL